MEPICAVIAEFTLLPTEVSGKSVGYRTGVRPNHNFPQLASYAIGHVELLDGERIDPGQTQLARIEFLGWPALRALLAPGTEWEIREAATPVGRAKLVELVGDRI